MINQCPPWYPLKYTLTCRHRPLSQLFEVLPPQDPRTKEASMPSVLELLCAKPRPCLTVRGTSSGSRWGTTTMSHVWSGLWTNLRHLSIGYYWKWACRLQYVSVIAIPRIVSVEDCLSEHRTQNTSQVVVQMQLIIMKYSQLSCNIAHALIPQLLLWHLHWLLSVQSMGDLHASVLLMWHGDNAPIFKTH
jgi:hypothetical protein